MREAFDRLVADATSEGVLRQSSKVAEGESEPDLSPDGTGHCFIGDAIWSLPQYGENAVARLRVWLFDSEQDRARASVFHDPSGPYGLDEPGAVLFELRGENGVTADVYCPPRDAEGCRDWEAYSSAPGCTFILRAGIQGRPTFVPDAEAEALLGEALSSLGGALPACASDGVRPSSAEP